MVSEVPLMYDTVAIVTVAVWFAEKLSMATHAIKVCSAAFF